ncbi:hypothetical protein EYR40_003206 [Pleurotus pulmonarius]|nr:hypothetical protein EYR40_003206 [Pleurotus pulmonarius]
MVNTVRTYLSLVDQAIADNTTFGRRNATEYRTLLGRQNGYRPVVAATQKAQVGFKSTNNTSLICLDGNAALNGINLYLSSVDNIWIQNLKLVPPQDRFSAPEMFPSSYDVVGLLAASNVWVDNCALHDQLSGEYVEPAIIEPGWQVSCLYISSLCAKLTSGVYAYVDRFNGLSDCEDGTDNVTFSHNIIRNHHKSPLLVGGTKQADRDLGEIRFTVLGNYFNVSASRNPLMRFGPFNIFSNVYKTRNDKPPRFGDAMQAHRRDVELREGLNQTPLDVVFQYNPGVYNQSRVQVQDNVFLEYIPFRTTLPASSRSVRLPFQMSVGNASPFSVDYQWGHDSQPDPGYDRHTIDFFVEPWRELRH